MVDTFILVPFHLFWGRAPLLNKLQKQVGTLILTSRLEDLVSEKPVKGDILQDISLLLLVGQSSWIVANQKLIILLVVCTETIATFEASKKGDGRHPVVVDTCFEKPHGLYMVQG